MTAATGDWLIGLLPEIYRSGTDETLKDFLTPCQQLLDQLRNEIAGDAVTGGGGLADLVDLTATPPAALPASPSTPQDFLAFLMSWTALPLRPEKSLAWNRAFATIALPLQAWRGTRRGLRGMLRAWLAGDVVDPGEPEPGTTAPVVVSDLLPETNGATASLQLDVSATLGVDTVLGLAQPGLIVVDLVVAQGPAADSGPGQPTFPGRHPAGLDVLQRAAQSLLDADCPLHAAWELRLRGDTLRLAPADSVQNWPDEEIYAQLGSPDPGNPSGTALLWDAAWVTRSENSGPGT